MEAKEDFLYKQRMICHWSKGWFAIYEKYDLLLKQRIFAIEAKDDLL